MQFTFLLAFFFFLMIRRPPRSTLFPYRRSSDLAAVEEAAGGGSAGEDRPRGERDDGHLHALRERPGREQRRPVRSEEHTSELQSLAYLVCRLLLEKKKPAQII